MTAAQERPAYAAYLPLRNEAGAGGELHELLALYETFLSGYREREQTTHFSSSRGFATPSAQLAAIIATDERLSYDAATSELRYEGPISVAERARLQELATPLSDAAERESWHIAVEDLYQESHRLASPRRLLSSQVALNRDTVSAALRQALADEANISYDADQQMLAYAGSMAPAHRDRLLAITTAPPLGAAAQFDYERAIEALYLDSQRREEAMPGLDELLDSIEVISDPTRAPAPRFADNTGYFDDDFVSYLAQWIGVTLRESWPERRKRRFIRNIAPLYKRRGTLEGIRQVLRFFVKSPVNITEELGFQVGVRSTIGRRSDTIVGGRAHMFFVEIPYGFRNPGEPPQPFDFETLRTIRDTTRSVLDTEKPAHTGYDTNYRFPGFVVADYSTIGFDSLVVPRL